MAIGPVRSAVASVSTLGEGAVWDAGRACLWFVDIKARLLWRFDPASGEAWSVEAPGQIGWALTAQDGLLLCGMQDGLYTFDPQASAFAFLMAVPGEPASNRLNDACVDAHGRVWFGSMDDGEKDASGRFYRFDRGAIDPVGPAGIAITNGPAVSPDGRTIYFTDTLARTITQAAIDTDGQMVDLRPFTRVVIEGAYPDGPVVDAEGCVWTGLWNGWAVARYSPDGRLIDRVDLPVANATKLAFGGAQMNCGFVTTARKGLSDTALERQPLAGNLLQFDSPVDGFVPPLVRLG